MRQVRNSRYYGRVLAHYTQHIQAHGYAPTLKEAAAAIGCSYALVSRIVSALVDDGLLAYHPRRVWRGVVLPGTDERIAA